jgi:Hypothetical glycosyl hydrolase family 15
MQVMLLAALLALAAFGSILAPTRGEAAVAEHFCLSLDTPATFSHPARTAERNSYVVLQAWETAKAAELKSFDPNLTVLVYQNLSAMAEGTSIDGLSSSGVNFAEADLAHPGWFLTEANGNRIGEENYPWLFMADVAVPSYQRQWSSNVLGVLHAGPWDGVFLDDTNTTAEYNVDPPSRIAQMPTDAAYQAAVGSMLAYAGPKIREGGFLAIANVGAWPQYPKVVAGWLHYLSGAMDQQFVKWSPVRGKGYVQPARWLTQLREIETTESMHRRFLGVTHAPSGDNRAVRFGWATILLGARGHTAFYARSSHPGETWSPVYNIEIGTPTSRAEEFQGGLWRRRFSNGLVVVNPQTTSLPVNFGTHAYSGSGLTDSRGTTMLPHTALVLRRG